MAQVKRKDQKVLTRQKIMETAFRIYSDTGFFAPTNEIAKEAGVSHGTVFVYFPTREILQLSVLEQFADEVGNELHNLSVSNAGVEELLCAHIGILEKYESFYSKVISEMSSLPKETITMLISLRTIMSHHLGVVIEREQQIIKDIPLHILFNTWMGLLHYYLQNGELFAPGASVLKTCKNELVVNFVRLISK